MLFRINTRKKLKYFNTKKYTENIVKSKYGEMATLGETGETVGN